MSAKNLGLYLFMLLMINGILVRIMADTLNILF